MKRRWLLGPVECQGCRKLVVLGLNGAFFEFRWRDKNGHLHKCPARPEPNE